MRKMVAATGFKRTALGGEAMRYQCMLCKAHLYGANMIKHLEKKHAVPYCEAKNAVDEAYDDYRRAK